MYNKILNLVLAYLSGLCSIVVVYNIYNGHASTAVYFTILTVFCIIAYFKED